MIERLPDNRELTYMDVVRKVNELVEAYNARPQVNPVPPYYQYPGYPYDGYPHVFGSTPTVPR